jgi:hypothetical protein
MNIYAEINNKIVREARNKYLFSHPPDTNAVMQGSATASNTHLKSYF